MDQLMNITNQPIGSIVPYSKNAKEHSDKQIDQVAKSIDRFGWAQPLVVDQNNNLIIGHCRLLAAKKLNLETVPVIKLENLSEEEVKSLRLADNKLNESAWNMELVVEELKGLDSELLSLTGFSSDLVLDDDEKDDEVPELTGEPESKLGDIYQLGAHTVMCGDATSAEDLEKLMGSDKADMVFTDPPYNINYKGQGKNTSNTILADNLEASEFETFLKSVFDRYREATKTGAPLYVFHDSSTQDTFHKALDEAGFDVKNQIIWNKPSAGMGMGDYRKKHEPFFYAHRKGEKTMFYGEPHQHSTVWDFQKSDQELLKWAKKMKKAEAEGKTTVWTMKRENTQGYVHPTQKPVELITYALTNSSKSGDTVLDLFLGSGSTLIACEKLGRVCKGMDLDPQYVDVVVTRYCEYVGSRTIIKNGEEITWQK